MAALRRLAMEFLGKFRAEVDRVICFGLGFRVKASRDIRKRMGWVFSRLGLKPKLHFGCKLRGRRKPRPLVEGFTVYGWFGSGGGLNGVRLGVVGDKQDINSRLFFESSGVGSRLEFVGDDRCRLCLDGFPDIAGARPDSSGGG